MAKRKRLTDDAPKTPEITLPEFDGTTPVKSIRAKCLDCTGQQPEEIVSCTAFHCPLWHYRMGKKPQHPSYRSYNAKAMEAAKLGKKNR